MSLASLTKPIPRNTSLDGWRGIAVSCVCLSHALNYRFSYIHTPEMLWAQKLSGQCATIGVQVLFVISGFIITSMLQSEFQATGKVNVLAFYMRRICRIMPPALGYFLFISMAIGMGYISMPQSSTLNALLFGCNINSFDCQWFNAHTWSWAVTQQYYIIWPLLFGLIAPVIHSRLLILLTITLMAAEALRVPVYHSNFVSFACISAGAAYARSKSLQNIVIRFSHPLIVIMVGLVLALGVISPLNRVVNTITPIFVLWLLFASIHMDWVKKILAIKPIQIVGALSYSLFLWQQFFFAKLELYAGSPPEIILLPIVVMASYLVTEMPFAYISHKISNTFHDNVFRKNTNFAIVK